MMALAISVNLPPVYLTTFSEIFGGLSAEQLGRIPALIFIGLVTGTLLTGPLADRWGPKPFLLLGLGINCAGLILLSQVWSYFSVLLAVATMGFGTGVLDMVLSPIVATLRPERRGSALNWLHSFYCIGAVFTILISFLSEFKGISVSFRVISLILLVIPAATLVGFLPVRVPPLIAGTETMPIRKLFRERYFHAALLAIFLAGATELGMSQWLPAYTELGIGYEKWVGKLAFLGFAVAMTLGRFAAGHLGHRFAVITMMILGCLGSAVGYLLGSFSGVGPVALAACILVGFTCSILWPSILAVAADRYPQGGATMFAWLGATGNMGGIFMPWAIGLIAGQSSLRWGILTTLICPLLLIGLLLWMNRQRRLHLSGPPTEVTGVQIAD